MVEKRRKAANTPKAVADTWEQRTLLVKREVAATNAATDAKTARLRALRMERDRQNTETNTKPIRKPTTRG